MLKVQDSHPDLNRVTAGTIGREHFLLIGVYRQLTPNVYIFNFR